MTEIQPTRQYGLLPYQMNYLRDQSRKKIVEKSRRVGFTYVQALEDVLDATDAENSCNVWFSSRDDSAAEEYILECQKWAKVVDKVGGYNKEIVFDDDKKPITVHKISFATGKRITAMASSPDLFRSKGGKVVIDEYAFHKDQDALWRAASPTAMRGHKIRILSTYNGKGNRYYRMVQDAKKDDSDWVLHTVTIEDAVEQGFCASLGRDDSPEGRKAYLKELRNDAGDEETFQQEYMCNPSDETSAWLPFSLITPAERDDAGKPELYTGTPVYVGMDIGRKSDATVIHVLEKVGDIFWVRERFYMVGATFAYQHAVVGGIFTRYKVAKMHIDATGLGMNFAEDVQTKYGSAIVQDVTFTNTNKHHLANIIKQRFEDIQIRIPFNKILQDSLHAIKKTKTETTSAPKFDADRNAAGHADDFWALALALDAANMPVQEYDYTPCGNFGDDDYDDWDANYDNEPSIY